MTLVAQEHAIAPILVATCENIARPGRQQKTLWPDGNGDPYKFFVQDPFGLRRAIVPVFLGRAGGPLVGLGTAFHIDHWGTLVTADHVIDQMRQNMKFRGFEADTEQHFHFGINDPHPYVVFGGISGYGRYRLPDEAVSRILSVRSVLRKSDDPLASLQGRSDAEIAIDVAVLKTGNIPPAYMRDTFPLRVSGWKPKIGDTVVAVGFPEIGSQVINPRTELHSLSEKMYAAYGRVTAAYPHGRDKSNRTPVVEVEADWPSGMSGAPVFNQSGEVIGLVSRSLEGARTGLRGRGWAVCFQLIPELKNVLPMIDSANPNWRLGWAVRREMPWHIAAFCETQSEAEEVLKSVGREYEAVFGSCRIGTSDFVSTNTPPDSSKT